MIRCLRAIIWAAGSCVIWCPICACVSSYGAWWVCASTVSLISITIISGYSMWTVLNQLLYNKESKVQQFLSRYINFSTYGQSVNRSSFVPESSLLEKEISSFAQTFHLNLILPWYSHISPEEKYALQIRSALEDLLTGLFKNIQQHLNLTAILQEIIMLYIQHYRQFYKALKKTSHKTNAQPKECLRDQASLASCYKPLHSAFKTNDGIQLHCQRLSHLLLVNYLPLEVSRCGVLFFSLRDLFAQNILHSILEALCDTQWLNKTLCSLLSPPHPPPLPQETVEPQTAPEAVSDKAFSYMHSLSAIREETSFDLSEIEQEIKASGGKISATLLHRLSSMGSRSFSREHDEAAAPPKEGHKLTFENAEELINYIRAPPQESVPSVKSALGDFISTTTLPVLSDNNAGFLPNLQPLPNKMWISPMDEKDILAEVVPKKKNPFKKNIVEGLKEEDYKLLLSSRRPKCDLLDVSLAEEIGGGDLQRSKSLTNLNCSTDQTDAKDSSSSSSTKLSFSTESLCRSWSEPKENPSDVKRDKKLTKMDSFDKNDGTDEFSVRSNRDTCENKDTCAVPPKAKSPSKESINDSLSPSEETAENQDLSPIYEESENLASTIAKLRCLLSERQSQHSLGSQSSFGSSESEPKSAQSDPGRYNLEKSRFTFLHKDSSGSVKSTSSADSFCAPTAEEEVVEASEVPYDGRVFIGISIPATEVHSETAGFQYTMYSIQYDAIYLCETVCSTSSQNCSTEDPLPQEHKMVLQTNCVKRRFREFLTLQSSLEADTHLRLCMKGVKGPNKWLNLPFSKLDSATISSRRLFLEKYLQSLIQRPSLNSSVPLKEFLAYGSDASVSFVKKPLELNVPRIDKLLARTVSGMFHSIKTALPTFDSAEGGPPNVSLLTALKNGHPLETASKSPVGQRNSINNNDFEIQLDMTAEEQNCAMEGAILEVITSTSELNSPVEAAYEALESSVSFLPKSSPLHQTSFTPVNPMRYFYLGKMTPNGSEPPPGDIQRLRSDSLSREESQDEYNIDSECGKDFQLFKCAMDAVIEVVSWSDHPITRQASTDLIQRLCAKPISALIHTVIDSLTSDESLEWAFQRLRSCLIDALDSAPTHSEPTFDQSNYKSKIETAILDAIPHVVKYVLGEEITEDSVSLLVESFQQPMMNQDFGLHLIDLLFVHVLLPLK